MLSTRSSRLLGISNAPLKTFWNNAIVADPNKSARFKRKKRTDLYTMEKLWCTFSSGVLRGADFHDVDRRVGGCHVLGPGSSRLFSEVLHMRAKLIPLRESPVILQHSLETTFTLIHSRRYVLIRQHCANDLEVGGCSPEFLAWCLYFDARVEQSTCSRLSFKAIRYRRPCLISVHG